MTIKRIDVSANHMTAAFKLWIECERAGKTMSDEQVAKLTDDEHAEASTEAFIEYLNKTRALPGKGVQIG